MVAPPPARWNSRRGSFTARTLPAGPGTPGINPPGRRRHLLHAQPPPRAAAAPAPPRHYRHPARYHAARDDPARHDDQSCADQAGRWLVQGYRRQRLYCRRERRCRRERQSDEWWHRHRRAGTREGDHLRPGLCQRDLVHLESIHLDAGGTCSTHNHPPGPRPPPPPPAITVTPPVTTPPVTTPPVTTTNPVLIKPGVGSFKDTAGNVYTVAANGDADENGNLMNGGTATGAVELAKGIIYGQDSATGTWYTSH